MAMQGTVSIPWWQALDLREEIIDSSGRPGDVQVSLYRVAYEQGANRPRYADTSYYGRITEPTTQLVELLARIAIRLGGGAKQDQGRALIRLDQGMGGGKSHACIGAWHLATSPQALAAEDIGRKVFEQAEMALGQPLPKSLNRPHVVVLSCDNITPGAPDPEQDGQWAYNLYERFLWRLFAGLSDQFERFESFKSHFASKAKIGEAIASLDRPVLLIVDEILNYIGDGLEGSENQTLAAQDMAFLRALVEAVTSVPHVSMIIVMISSEKDSTTLRGGGEARRADLESYLQRQGVVATSVNENADFTSILRRRLFAAPVSQADADKARAEAIAALAPILEQGAWKSRVFGLLNGNWTRRFAAEVERTFPFHPQLMDLAETEWANLAGFQQVRSTIMIFAATVYALTQRAKKGEGEWVPLLIGPGDLPLSDPLVRDAVITSGLIKDLMTQNNYRSIAQSDIVNLEDNDGTARRLDLDRAAAPWAKSNPRAAERAATMIYLASIVGARGGSRRGASEPEVKAATMVPNPAYDYAEADSVVRDLIDTEARGLATVEVFPGRGGQPPRYFLSTQQRLPMLIRAMRNTVTESECHAAIAERTQALLKPGPFAEARFIPAGVSPSRRGVLVAADLDQPRTTRLFVLDPAIFTMGNGTQQATLDAVTAVLGLGPDPVAVRWAPSAVFLVASARSAGFARGRAADYAARQKVLAGPEIETDQDMAARAAAELSEASGRLDDAIQRAFQSVLYLTQPDPMADRSVTQRSLEHGTLNGTVIWNELAEAQKTFRPGTFDATALLHNLRDADYQRPLGEVRDAFWNTPRLSLLPTDGADLRQAIFQAVRENRLRIVRAGGETVVVNDLTGINFNAPTYRLAKPEPAEPVKESSPPDAPGKGQPGRGDGQADGQQPPEGKQPPHPPGGDGDIRSPAEQVFAFSIMKNLVSEPTATDSLAQLFRRLFDLLDRGSVSYLQGTLQVQLPAAQAQEIAELAKSMGIAITIRDR
jgi:uncharacterized protein DUF499